MKKSSTLKITLAGLFAALIFAATYISFPLPSGQGYVNMGDGFIMLASAFLGPIAIAAAAIGSMLTDVVLGYFIYAPATFVIKGVIALISCLFIKLAQGKKGEYFISVGGFFVAEVVMIGGYFVYECILYGFAGALAGVPFNGIQGIFAILIGAVGYPIIKKIKNRFDI